ncbi:Zn-dependent hydrolase [Lederbergia panacisoli]|uniref:Zn-dependent hydrolase n=1 Tax=Lederbergia panacisoli TaxID=1255251 RepID=UPI00214C11B5|nr:Zn-dependent hydrolase [Lederbergia panacisoli]MCR2821693.1 Zn-dependent hydrolase [Lederbergia panacisoli]
MTISFNLHPNQERIQNNIEMLATMVDQSKPGWTRRPFTSWYKEGRAWLKQQMEQAGLQVSIDAGGNLIGRLSGSEEHLKPIMIGSHTDTVTGGGRFDGIIGVIAGIEIARRLQETGTTLRHTLEIVDFTAEEPSEFGISTIGSRSMVGNLTAEMLERTDQTGLVLDEGIRMIGGNPDEIYETARKTGDVSLYLELHIEQGPVLEQNNMKLGVVTGIVGIHRYRVIVEGKPNHAGTTPMNMRFDALTGASELVLELENLCKFTYSDPVVGTVGKFTNEPNGANVIPGRVIFELEVRSIDSEIIENIMSSFSKYAALVAAKRQLDISLDNLSKSDSIRVLPDVQDKIAAACSATGKTQYLPSGAGHDANQLASIAPVGMIFVPSREGRSHCPEEWTDFAEVALGVEALARALINFDQDYIERR